jgi:hypothetical protein
LTFVRISEANFPLLLEYISSIRGAMREQTRAGAQQKRDKAAQWQVGAALFSVGRPWQLDI